MASILCDLVKKYVDKLIDGAIAEARYVFCFTCIVKKFEEERTTLEPQRITIEQRVKDARERDKDIQAIVGSWEKDIDELNQVDTKTKQTCFFGFCPNCIWRYKKGKELSNNLEKIKQLKGEKFENIELPRPVPGVERYSSKDYISFESRESKYKELLDALKDDNNYITGLQGMGGTGKTTMAKEVGKELKQSEIFAYVVDTTVSFTPDIKKIQDDIAGSLRLEWGGCNEPDRPKKLWSRLTNGDKILVILDDVWDRGLPLDFDAIGIPKQDTHKGCRVLVTSRNQETFNNMDCDKIIELGLLSEEEAWIMFKMYAKISDSTSQKLIDKGRKIAKECKRLPVAISVIASSLKGHQHREHKWDVTLKSLKKPVSMHGVDDDKVGIYNLLKISYDNLKDEKAKGLFLLCSVFREDEENSIEVITRLCIGVGLLGEDYGSYDDARNLVVLAKDKLVDSCLLLEGGEKCLKLHDLVREAAQWIANKEIQCVKLFDEKQKSLVEKQTNIKYLLCEGKCKDLFSLEFDSLKLETLIVKVDREEEDKCIKVPDSFFENVIRLRVLNFSGIHFSQSLSLPPAIQLLTNIRSMSFDHVDLGDISILGKLQRLETLDLDTCKVNELPNQITELKKFKLLKLEGCQIRMNNPFEVIERCSSLEELYFKYSFNEFCKEIALPELKRYHIHGRSSFYSEGQSRFSKYVVFRGDEKCQFSKGTLKYCMQTAEALFLEGIKGEWRNLMPEIFPLEHGMNDLVELHLDGISQLRCLIDNIGSHVPILSNLVVLELENMENLEQLFNGKANLCNLKRITLKNCPMLISILPFLSAKDLPALEAIRIRKCDGLQYVFGQSQHVELVSLTELELSELPNFIGIFEECVKGSSSTSKAQIQLDPMRDRDQPHDCSVASESNSYGLNIWERLGIQSKILCNIKEIVLTHFPKMKSVFILSIDLIMQLETLKIMNCDELKHVIIDTGDHNTSGNICVNVFPKLKELSVKNCAQLEYIFGHDTSDHQNDMGIQLHLPELRYLHLASLPSLIAMCPKQYRITFPSLKSLRLNECSQDNTIIKELSGNIDLFLTLKNLQLCNSNVEHIFSLNEIDEQQLDLALRFIALTDLPMMTCLFVGPKNSFSLKNLTGLTIMRCDKLKIAFSTSILRFLPQLLYLTIEECKELEHIIEDDLENQNNSTTCFPKLEDLAVRNCNKLKFVFSSTSMLRFLPQLYSLRIEDCKELEHIIEDDLENKNNSTTCFPKLEVLTVRNCNKLKFVFSSTSMLRVLPQLNSLRIEECKELEHIIEDDLENKNNSTTCFPKLEHVTVRKCNKLKFVFSSSMLRVLPMLLYLTIEECKELEHIIEDDLENKNNSTTCFPKLKSLAVRNCNKLKFVFSTSMLRVLPQLRDLTIEDCKELEHIIEDDLENKNNSTTCFPKLQALLIIKCNKLKFVFPFSVCKEVPELTFLMITEANELEKIFKSEDDQKVDIPNLNVLVFDMLPSLCCAQGNQFQAVKNRFVRDCQQLKLKSASTTNTFIEIERLIFIIGYGLYKKVDDLFKQLRSAKSTKDFDTESKLASVEIVENAGIEQLPSAKITEDFELPVDQGDPSQKVEDLAILPTNSKIQMKQTPKTEHEFVENVPDLAILPTKSGELQNEQSLGETDTTVQSSQLEGSTSEKTAVATVSSISRTKNEPPMQVVTSKQKGIEIEGTSKTNNDQASLNGDALMKVNSYVEEQFSKDDEIIVSKSEPSPSITSSVASKGDPSQKLEDLAILATNSKIQIKQTPKAEHEFVKNVMDLAIIPTNSEELLNEQSLGETDTIIKPSQVNNLDGSTSEKTPVATMSTISGTKNEPPIQVVASKQKGIEVEIEGVSKTNNDQVSPNGDAFMKVNSNVEEQFSKDDELIVSKSKPSSPMPSMPSKGNPSQKVELSSSLLVKRELEELVSKNHLKYKNLSLLSDFLVENPSVRLKDTSLSNRYKGCAYKSLAKLLKFLKTHSLLEVSGSSHSEFVELLQDARSFAFDKEWLDGVERRALFPEIQVFPDAMEKLLDSKKKITKNVEDLKHQLTSSEADLESIIQQEAILSAPIGY
ncbi:unnamed protein product [Trifolium pratense]|uniref:Uncharacterized protein n=1 Tax=Trifolium pratense TaxID=57577 RepID=A0ACB0L3B8_TRIPR|nr:unnamed protein product [Trifolium pratense]